MKRFMVGVVASLILFAGALTAQAEEVLMVTWGAKYVSETEFEKKLKELRPGVKFTYVDSERKKGVLAKKLREIDVNKYDLVYSFGTTGTKIVKQYLKGKKPQVFNIVSVPVLSKIANSMEKPGNNLTGARLLVDIKTQLDVADKLKPFKKLGVYFDPREKQNAVVLSQIKKYGAAAGKEIVPIRIVPDAANYDAMLGDASAKANTLDAVYIIASSSYADQYKKMIGKIDPKIMVMGSISTYVEAGATLALGADFGERGRATAELAGKILGGAKAGDLPVSVVTQKNAALYVNKAKKDVVGLGDIEKLGMNVKYLAEK
ncbi:MAG: ABC transporter substrate binding protein [Methyloligellaceae bacterium]